MEQPMKLMHKSPIWYCIGDLLECEYDNKLLPLNSIKFDSYTKIIVTFSSVYTKAIRHDYYQITSPDSNGYISTLHFSKSRTGVCLGDIIQINDVCWFVWGIDRDSVKLKKATRIWQMIENLDELSHPDALTQWVRFFLGCSLDYEFMELDTNFLVNTLY